MKTVIARFTEMKKAASDVIDVDGETVDVNKVDTALKSVGVSLKDTNGQFRDLDDVFLELSAKWNSLDKMSQRYVATMAAGSRQQSRFIAMMQNYSRTVELVDAANDSSGASNEQFEKTLDSLEAKINTLKDVWQEFILGLTNSSVIKFGVEVLTKLVEILNRATTSSTSLLTSLLKWGTIITAFSIVRNFLKGYLDGIINLFTKKFGQAGREAGKALRENLEKSSKVDSVADKAAKTVKKKLSDATATGYAQKAISDAYNSIKSSNDGQPVKLSALLGTEISLNPRSKKGSKAIGNILGGTEEYKLIQSSIEQLADQAIHSAAKAKGGFSQAGEQWAQELVAKFKLKLSTEANSIEDTFNWLKWVMSKGGDAYYNQRADGSQPVFTIDEAPKILPETGSESDFGKYTEKMEKAAKATTKWSVILSTLGMALGAIDQKVDDSSGILTGFSTGLTTAGSALMTLTTILQVFQVTLSAGPLIAITAAIAIISGLIAAIQKKKQAEKEAREATIEEAKTSQEEADSLNEQTKAYSKLLKTYKETGEGKDDLKEQTKELIEQYKNEISGLEALGDNYDAVLEKITEYNKEKQKKNVAKQDSAIDAANQLIESDSKAMATHAGTGFGEDGKFIIKGKLEIDDKQKKAIQKNIDDFIKEKGYKITFDFENPKEAFSGIDSYQDKVDAFYANIELRQQLYEEGLEDTRYYQNLDKWIKEVTAGIENLDSAIQGAIISTKSLIASEMQEEGTDLGAIDNYDEYIKAYDDYVKRLKDANEQYNWGLSEKQIRNQAKSVMAEFDNLTKYVQQQNIVVKIRAALDNENSEELNKYISDLKDSGDIEYLVGVKIENIESLDELKSIVAQKKVDFYINLQTNVSSAAASVMDALLAQSANKKLTKEQNSELLEFESTLSKLDGIYDSNKTALEEFYGLASQGTLAQINYLETLVDVSGDLQEATQRGTFKGLLEEEVILSDGGDSVRDMFQARISDRENELKQSSVFTYSDNPNPKAPLFYGNGALTQEGFQTLFGVDSLDQYLNYTKNELKAFNDLVAKNAEERKTILAKDNEEIAKTFLITTQMAAELKSNFDLDTGDLISKTYTLEDLGIDIEFDEDKDLISQIDDALEKIKDKKVELEVDVDANDASNKIAALNKYSLEIEALKLEVETSQIEKATNMLEVLEGHITSLRNVMDSIGEGLTIKASDLDEIRNLAPQLLADATVTSDGLIKLTQKDVDTYIDGQIQKLEASKKVALGEAQTARESLDNQIKDYEGYLGAFKKGNDGKYHLEASTDAAIVGMDKFLNDSKESNAEESNKNVADSSQVAADAQITNTQRTVEALNTLTAAQKTVAENYANTASGNYDAVQVANHQVKTGGTVGGEGIEVKERSSLQDHVQTSLKENGNIEYLVDDTAYQELENYISELKTQRDRLSDEYVSKYYDLQIDALKAQKNNLGKSKSSGSKDSSGKEKDPYKSEYDDTYKLLQDVEKEQENRNALEEELSELQDKEFKNYDAIRANIGKQIESLEREKALEQEIQAIREASMKSFLASNTKWKDYATYDFEQGEIVLNIDKINTLNGDTSGKGEEFDKYMSELEKLSDNLKTSRDNIKEVDKSVKELNKSVKETNKEQTEEIGERIHEGFDLIQTLSETAFELMKISLDRLYNTQSALDGVKRVATRLEKETEKLLREKPWDDGDEIDFSDLKDNIHNLFRTYAEEGFTAQEQYIKSTNDLYKYSAEAQVLGSAEYYDQIDQVWKKNPYQQATTQAWDTILGATDKIINLEAVNTVAKKVDETFGDTGFFTLALGVAQDVVDFANNTNKQKDELAADRLEKAKEAEEARQNAFDTMMEVYDKLYELQSFGLEQYQSLEDSLHSAIVEESQKQLDELSSLNDNIQQADEDLVDALRDNLAAIRQQRENNKTEQDLQDKERRLAYLRQDSGANQQEILKLEKELNDAQESYTDTLIDQKIDELEKQNEEAAEQRQIQIDLMQASLENEGEQWSKVQQLMVDLINENGELNPDEVIKILRSTKEYQDATDIDKQQMEKEWYQQINGAGMYRFIQQNPDIFQGEIYKRSTISLFRQANSLFQNIADAGSGYIKEGFAMAENWNFGNMGEFIDYLEGMVNHVSEEGKKTKLYSDLSTLYNKVKDYDRALTGSEMYAKIGDMIETDTGLSAIWKKGTTDIYDEQYTEIKESVDENVQATKDNTKALNDNTEAGKTGEAETGETENSLATIFEKIITALKRVDWAAVFSALAALITFTASAAVTLAPKIEKLVEWIIGLVSKGDKQGENKSDSWSKVGNFLKGSFEEIIKVITSEKMQQIASTVITAILGLISGAVSQKATGGYAEGGPTLVGERGIELVQSKTGAYLVGIHGPELTNLQKGDYVYNNSDTKKLFRNGKMIPRYENGIIPFNDPLKAYAYKIPNYSSGIKGVSESNREMTSNIYLNMDGVLVDSPQRVDEVANRVFDKIKGWTQLDNNWLNRR